MLFHKAISPSGKYHRKVFLISFGGHLYRFDVEDRAVAPQTDGLTPGELVCALFSDGISLVGANQNRVLQYDHERRLFLPFLELPELPGQEDKVSLIAFRGHLYFNTVDGLQPVFEGETIPIPLEFTDKDFGTPPQRPGERL